MYLRTQCGYCGEHFLAEYKIVGENLCDKCKPADLPGAGASAERICSVVRNNATTGWIKVSDRLPGNTDNVLVYHKNEGVIFAWYDNDWQDRNNYYSSKLVTHWMPLPEPPEV